VQRQEKTEQRATHTHTLTRLEKKKIKIKRKSQAAKKIRFFQGVGEPPSSGKNPYQVTEPRQAAA